MTHIELGLAGGSPEDPLADYPTHPTRLPEVTDVEQARALLAANGHEILDGSVVRDRKGHRIELEVDPGLGREDEVLLKGVGFTMLDGTLH